MSISRFFIARPIFAWVIAIVIMLAGLASIMNLPVAQYPDVAPPTVGVSATYPGASAETLESSVTQVLEQQLTGLDGMLYFSSSSSSAGTASITVTFAKGTDPDTAQVQVQNKIQQALSRLPSQVQQQGVQVTKRNSDFLLIVSIYDTADKATPFDIADYLVSNFQDPLSRVEGVGSVQVFGSPYAMRIWLDPYKLRSVALMPSDVTAAIQAQNAEVSAGQLGAAPSSNTQQLNATVTAQSRLQTPEQFRDIILKTQTNGAVVRLGDVARVELGAENYGMNARFNRHPSSGIAIQLAPGGDALDTAELVKAEVARLEASLPAGYEVGFPRDSTDFIKLSIKEVVKTLLEAIVLVVIVMFVFLQSWRATLIPAIAVPVVLLGTFGVLFAFGYSINTLTLFGMVLSIGLLVDDAIVVVENVERLMAEEGLSPKDATIKSMDEISGALVGIGLVISAVLLPMAFFGGSTGVIYQQFSVTVITSMLLSVVVALVLSPALCVALLKPSHTDPLERRGIGGKFNRWFDKQTNRYVGGAKSILSRRVLFLGVYAAVAVVMAVLFLRLPTSFLPVEDQGSAMVQWTLPSGATVNRSAVVAEQVEDYFLDTEGENTRAIFTINGFSFGGSGQNAGMGFSMLNDFEERKGKEASAEAITGRATAALSQVRDAQIFALTPPAISGLGQSNGFTFQLLNTGGLSAEQFQARQQALMAAAAQDPELAAVRPSSLPDTPQLRIDMDQAKLSALGLTQANVTSTLSAAWGGSYVNDFVDRGRVKRVFVQGDQQYRSVPTDLDNWGVRGADGQITPFSAFATTRWDLGPSALARFNGQSSVELQGQAAAGVSSGEAMARMAELQSKLEPGTSFAWSGLSYEEQRSGGQAPLLYAISILAVFLCLAALYESWSVPFAILLAVPLGVIGAVLAVTLRDLDNSVYFQVGLLTTIGLTAKNAILIVEFAEAYYRQGQDAVSAALHAARIRLRPILMTSIAFIAGCVPLAIASGAGAASRVALGTAVIGGMLSATVLAIFFVPLFFVVITVLTERITKKKPHAEPATAEGL
ncbi:efflux RND transporter permease subunit [Brevundimonas sp.]|jgi:multidrug efflux pump|uniref:efflux RND transporter permease subunit n=1 Tax=Brevundimonas sp. TaxID=1871086 RepID=UPI0037BFA43B